MIRYFRASMILILWLWLGFSVAHSQTEQSIIKEWLVLGTFPCDTIDQAIDRSFIADEAGIMPETGAIDQPSGLVWKKVEAAATGEMNFLDMNFPYSENCAVYAAAYIYSPTERNANLLIGSDDGLAVWLNDKLVHRNLVYRALQRAEDKVPVRFAGGWNRLLVKVFNGSGGFALAADIVDTKMEAFDDLVVTSRHPERLQAAEASAFAFIANLTLGPSYQVGKDWIYPLTVQVKNLGKDGSHRGTVFFDARRMRPKRQEFELRTSTQVIVPLKAQEVKVIVGKSIGVATSLEGRRCDEQFFKVTPEWVLQSLFSSQQLPIEAAVLKTLYTNLEENARWYSKFTGKSLETREASLIACVNHALDQNWDAFLKTLESTFGELKGFSSVIKQDTLHLIGQSHIDMAWLWCKEETVEVVRRTFQSALNFFKEEPEYKYIQSQAAAFVWMEKRYPELFKAIQDAVKQKRFFLVGGMWVEPDLNLAGGEALVRQFLHGKRYFRQKFGVDCITGYTPDTFGYTWTLPQLLKKAGFKYFVTTKIRWNDTTQFPYSLFHWVSPDGSDILTSFPMSLNSDCSLDEEASHLLAYKREGLTDLPVLYGIGDHGGGPTRQHFDKIKQMQALAAYPAVHHTDLDSYMEDVEHKYPNVPVYKDELYLEYHRGTLTTQGLIKRRNRKSEIALEEAEKFAVFAGAVYPQAKLEEAWKATLFNQFHDILPGSGIPEVYIDANRDYDMVEEITHDVIGQSLRGITDKIHLQGKGIPVVVFNPLSWERSDYVAVKLPAGQSIKEVVDSKGKKMVFQQSGDQVTFIAAQVPQSGYKTFWLREGKDKSAKGQLLVSQTTMENPFFLMEINPGNGNIRRLFDKRANREVLAAGQEGNVLQFLGDAPKQYEAWNIGYTGKSANCEKVEQVQIVETGPARAILRYVRTYGDSKFTQDYTMYADIPRLDIATQADWHERRTLVKAAFPVNVSADYATFDIAYGSIRRTTHPQTAEEKAKWEVSAHKYVDLSQADYGVALLNDCKYGHDVRDNVMRLTLLRSPRTPDPITRPQGYENPYADQGQHEFVYSLYPHAGDCHQAQSVRRGHELNYPLLPIITEPHKGSLEQTNSFIKITSPNLILTVVKKAEDSPAHIVRLYETDGQTAAETIQFNWPIRKAWEVNLMEERGKELPVTNGAVSIRVEPFAIYSLLVE